MFEVFITIVGALGAGIIARNMERRHRALLEKLK